MFLSRLKSNLHSIATAATTVFSSLAISACALTYNAPQLPTLEPEGDFASAPRAWASFCARYTSECDAGSHKITPTQAPTIPWDVIEKVNSEVNSSIRPMSDVKHWGIEDKWDLPTDGYGDCEDYALLKRHILIDLGISPEDLLITVVWDQSALGHAVLTLHTSEGDFVLDNQEPRILLWSRAHLEFVKRQSQFDPNTWIYIDGAPAVQPTVVASHNRAPAPALNLFPHP